MAREDSTILLARLRLNTLIACVAIAFVALAVDSDPPAAALGVLGGGVLIIISYAAVAFTIGVFMPSPERDRRPPSRAKKAFAVLLFVSHYALLAFAAYVMIGRLRLHPVGLLGGVTSLVAAVAYEAVRGKSRSP